MRVKMHIALLCVTLAFPSAGIVHAEENGLRPLFNGRDLSGWVNINCAPSTWSVRDGLIVCTGIPTGLLRTDQQYENYILELEWMHLKPGGNAGLFVNSDDLPVRGQPFTRSIEIQILDGQETENYTSHGDVFSIHGATMVPDRPHPAGWMRCLPSERRSKPAGQWNHYRVVCRDGTVKLSVNGKEVSGASACRPRKGYVCLESEGSEVHFRNLRIKELPSSNPPADEVAQAQRGFVSLYTGVDLAGWRDERGHAGHWTPRDWVLADGNYATNDDGTQKMIEIDDYGDSGIYLRGSSKAQVNIFCWPIGSGEVYGYRTDPDVSSEVRAGVTPKAKADNPPGEWNRFVITMKGDRLTVVLNDKTVLENAQLPGVPPRGPIALQHHGDKIEFANLYIKELDGR